MILMKVVNKINDILFIKMIRFTFIFIIKLIHISLWVKNLKTIKCWILSRTISLKKLNCLTMISKIY